MKFSFLFHFISYLIFSGVMAEKSNELLEMDKNGNKDFFNSSILLTESTEENSTQFHVSNVGRDRTPAGVPFNFQWKYSMSQTLYLSDEIGVSKGMLKGIQFEMGNSARVPGVNISIWVGETNRENVVMDWIDIFSLEKVYDRNTDLPQGINKIFFPFDKSYEYNGGNLVIHFHVATNTLFGDSYFFTTEITTTSRIKMSQRDDRPFQTGDQDDIGRLIYNLPNIGFYFAPEGLQAHKELQVVDRPDFISLDGRIRVDEIKPVDLPANQTDRARPITDPVTTQDRRINDQRETPGLRANDGIIRGRFSVGLDLAANLYDGDYLNALILPGADLSVGFLQNRTFSINYSFGVGRVESVDIFHANFAQTGLGLKYRPLNFNVYGSPFLQGGGGVLYHTQGTVFERELSFDRNLTYFVSFSLGYEWLIRNRGGFIVSLNNRQLLSDNIDGLVYGKYNDRIWSMNFGFKLYLDPGRR